MWGFRLSYLGLCPFLGHNQAHEESLTMQFIKCKVTGLNGKMIQCRLPPLKRIFLTPKCVLILHFKTDWERVVKYKHSTHINSFGFGRALARWVCIIEHYSSPSALTQWFWLRPNQNKFWTLNSLLTTFLQETTSPSLSTAGWDAIYKCLLNWSEGKLFIFAHFHNTKS